MSKGSKAPKKSAKRKVDILTLMKSLRGKSIIKDSLIPLDSGQVDQDYLSGYFSL